jgi:hypothetical protein
VATNTSDERPHRLRGLGYFDKSYALLGTEREAYLKQDGSPVVEEEVDAGSGGIVFGVMEKAPKAFLIVKVGDLILRAPVLFIPHRHGAKGLAPYAGYVDHNSAMQILVDAIVANPEYRDHLGEEVRRIGKNEGHSL